MTIESIIVLVVIVFIVAALYMEVLSPAMIFVAGVLVLGFFGVLTPREILTGFANEQIAIIVLLLLVGEVVRKNGIVDQAFSLFFRGTKTYRQFLFRMTAMVSALSAFLNNTPLVAVMMPYVHHWKSGDLNTTPSKLLIPLSYASILGGCATLVGTSTNLIVNSMIAEQQIIPGLRMLEMFEFAWVGLPMIILGVLYLVLVSDALLPANKDFFDDFKANPREYLVETKMVDGSALVGRSVADAGLRNLQGLFLVKIIRHGACIAPVHPQIKLLQHDVLVFAGETSKIADLLHRIRGIEAVESNGINHADAMHFVEGVVAYNSSLENKTIKEVQFRSRHDAAVVGVLRGGERLSGKIGAICLKAGDVLLMIAGSDFRERNKNERDFYVLSETIKSPQVAVWKAILPLLGLLLAIALAAFKLVPLFLSLSALLASLFILRLASAKDILGAVDYNLILIIAMSLALGVGMTKTGVAGLIADNLLLLMAPLGKIGILSGIYLVTVLFGSMMLNKAAVALLFPVVLTLSQYTGHDPIGLILCMTFAAAANFISPLGFQTNMMVYGPGGYSFKDFFRIGMPLSLLYMVTTVLILTVLY